MGDQSRSGSDHRVGEVEAAAYLGVKPTTLQMWRTAKRYGLPYIKMGRLVRYRLSDLDAFIEKRRVVEEVA